MAKIRDGRSYLGAHLTSNDYYCENEAVVGEWVGKGAELLSLRGGIHAGDTSFEALRQNRMPDGSGKLTPRDSDRRVRFFDFQCSAQKSVSIMAVTIGDTRLLAAHDAAARLAYGELEQFAARQANTALARVDVRTGIAAAASFRHTASRALDPQIHTHFVTANATWDEKIRGWRALTELQMVKAVRYAGKVYQNEMARACRSLGYSIIEVRDRKGSVTGFELAGVPPEICKRFSKRRAEIEQGIAEFAKRNGREPSAAEVHAITVDTRDAKLAEITTSAVLDAQRRQLTPDERNTLEKLRQDSLALTVAQEPELGQERESLSFASSQLYERRSVVVGHELLAEALNDGLGHLDLPQLKERAQEAGLIGLTDSPWLHESFASRAGLEAEQWAVGFVGRTRGTCAGLGQDSACLPAHLSAEQKAAATQILSSRDQVICFRGAAGVGKSTVLAAIRTEVAATGVPILVCAPTSSGADTLRRDGVPATSVTDLLQNIAEHEPHRFAGGLLIVDESGLASNRQGGEILRLAERHGSRVLFVGDTRQHSAVEAGDFLRVLETHSSLKRIELTSIRRQQVKEYREAVDSLAAGTARLGLEKLDRLGWVKESRADYLRNAAQDYLKLLGNGPVPADVLAVTPTWAEHDGFTRNVRTRLREQGLLPAGVGITIWEPLQWTQSQTADPRNYEVGMVASFHRSSGGFAAGDAAMVTRVQDGRVWAQTAGREQLLPVRRVAFTVSRTSSMEVSEGDKILIRANDWRSRLLNGERLTVAKVEAGILRFTDGRAVDTKKFGHLIHGYAVTSHASQSKTVDHVVVVARRLDAKAAYVACSRGRLSCAVHTPNKSVLLDHLSTGQRTAALDLEAKPSRRAALPTPDRKRIWARLVERTQALGRSAVRACRQGGELTESSRALRHRAAAMAKEAVARQSERVKQAKELSG